MAVPLNSVFEVRINYRVNDQHCINVFHYRNTAAIPDPDDARDVTAEILAEYGGLANGEFPGEFIKVWGTNVELFRIDAQAVYPVRWRASSLLMSHSGTHAGECEAQNLQWSASKYGAFAQPKELGAIHVGGMPTSEVANGNLSAAFKVKAQVLVSVLASPLILASPAATLIPCIANKSPIPGSDPVRYQYSGSTPIEDWALRDFVRTQRTRTKGNGI